VFKDVVLPIRLNEVSLLNDYGVVLEYVSMDTPLILVTNDDGIDSDGLWAAAAAVLPLGDVLVVAPDRQWSGGGRSMPRHVTGSIRRTARRIDGRRVPGFAVDASPALAVDHGVIELAPHRPALVVSGINFGANLGIEVTISGTVGAALEGSAFGIPALAVSLEMGAEHHLTGDAKADYAASRSFIRHFAAVLLAQRLPPDVDALNVNIPADATPLTSWRFTRLSRRRYFLPVPPDRANGEGRPGYKLIENVAGADRGTDIHTLLVDRMISVTPLSLDLTSRIPIEVRRRRLPPAEEALPQPTMSLFEPFDRPPGGLREARLSGLTTVPVEEKAGIAR
jgi:5'-nucleotidase